MNKKGKWIFRLVNCNEVVLDFIYLVVDVEIGWFVDRFIICVNGGMCESVVVFLYCCIINCFSFISMEKIGVGN